MKSFSSFFLVIATFVSPLWAAGDPGSANGKMFNKLTCTRGELATIEVRFARFYGNETEIQARLFAIYSVALQGKDLGEVTCTASQTDRRIVLCYKTNSDVSLETRVGVNSYGQTEYHLSVIADALKSFSPQALQVGGLRQESPTKVTLHIPYYQTRHVIRDAGFDGFCSLE